MIENEAVSDEFNTQELINRNKSRHGQSNNYPYANKADESRNLKKQDSYRQYHYWWPSYSEQISAWEIDNNGEDDPTLAAEKENE